MPDLLDSPAAPAPPPRSGGRGCRRTHQSHRPATRSPGIACRMFNTRGQKATNRIDTPPQQFPLFAEFWRRKRHCCDTTATANDGSAALESPAACRSSACVFITIGPYQAMGSRSGFPETSRNRISLLASLDRDLVATVERERASDCWWRIRASLPIDLVFGQDTKRLRCPSETTPDPSNT